jgi:hypothetical protein
MEKDGKESILKVFDFSDRAGRSIYFNVGLPDVRERQREIQISAFEEGRATVIQRTFTGKEWSTPDQT